jgi:hypothetical protein
MSVSKAQQVATTKYKKNKYDRMAIDEAIERDGKSTPTEAGAVK